MATDKHESYELYFEDGMPTMNIDTYMSDETGEIFFGLPGLKNYVENDCPEFNLPITSWHSMPEREYVTHNVAEILDNLVVIMNQPNTRSNPDKLHKIQAQINGLDLLYERMLDLEYDLTEEGVM